jgi:hypothetical protein
MTVTDNFRIQAFLAASCILTGAILPPASAAFAQDGGFPGPPPGMHFGGPGGPGAGPRPATVSRIPVEALATGLRLSGDQRKKIEKVQQGFRQSREKLMPRPAMSEMGLTQADLDRMRASGPKLRALEQSASRKITSLLTPAQKLALPALLKEADTMRQVGLPLELAYRLKLTAPQKKKLAVLAQNARQNREAGRIRGDFRAGGGDRERTRTRALAVLSASQRSAASAYLKAHPGRGFGGPPGGFRGPGGPGDPPPF